MNTSEYLTLMRDRLTAAFDFKEPPQGLNPQPALWAVHNRTSEKYFLSKSISLYTVNNDEYVGLYGCTDKIKETDIEAVFEQFKRLISEEEIDLKIVETASAKKFHKDFWFSLRGWADLAFILVDLKNEKIYSNSFGKRTVRNFGFPKKSD